MGDAARQAVEQRLKRRISGFLRQPTAWSPVLATVLGVAASRHWDILLFGGTLRDLSHERPLQPRDLDFVVPGVELHELEAAFGPFVERATRFGGLKLRFPKMRSADIWPLERTWAFAERLVLQADRHNLPRTTFLNVEAAAIQVRPWVGRHRALYSHGFFDALLSRTLEINLEENPFPDLCVVRSLHTARKLGFFLGPRLSRYLALYGSRLSYERIEEVQLKHYGQVRLPPAVVKSDLRVVRQGLDSGSSRIELPRMTQASLQLGTARPRSRYRRPVVRRCPSWAQHDAQAACAWHCQ